MQIPMYKKLFIILVGVLLLAHLSVMAQDISGYPIGFCNGEMSERSNIKFSGKGAEVSAAIHIPASYASSVGGNSLESIRVALASKMNLKSLEVWVRTSLEGENLASKMLEKGEFAQGWNNISLESPYTIPTDPGDGFYIGYTYVQTNKAGAISSLAIPHEGALFTKCDDEEWTDMSDQGTLCIEGMVFGDNLPKYNLCLLSVTPDPYYILSEGSIVCVAKVRNLATLTAKGFDIEAMVEDVEKPVNVHVDCDIPLGETRTYKFLISPDFLSAEPAKRKVIFTITSVDGHDDEDSADNSAIASFEILEKAFPRNVLAEEFTTEVCPNCPKVAEYFHEILADPLFADNLNVVCHHAGYFTDQLTTPFDEEYCWFYNDGGGTYAPAVMIDRKTYEDTYSPVFFPASLEDLESDILAQLKIPAMVSVTPSCSIDPSSNAVTVSVAGERVKDGSFDNDRITVWLVEDNIETRNQAGAGGTYVHNHVNRAANVTWGEPIEWNGNNYSYSCSFSIDSSWNMENLSVVAFISSFNPENPNDCTVANSGSCSLAPSSISEVYSGSKREIIRIYNAAGVATKVLSLGMNIVVYDDYSTKKVFLK